MKFRFNIQEFLATPAALPGILLNDLEEVVLKEHPQINQMKEVLLSAGAMGSLMTGSGPTVFGIFQDREDTLRAYRRVKNRVKDNAWIVLKAQSIP